MKTSEFIEKVEALEFVERVTEGKTFRGIYLEKNLFVQDEDNRVLVRVSVENDCSISTSYEVFEALEFKQRKRLFNLATQYAETPILERIDKTIEEKVREYIKEYVSDHLSFESARDFLETVDMYFNSKDENTKYLINSHLSHYTKEALEEYFEIYQWYRDNSNEFVKMWCEVAECES